MAEKRTVRLPLIVGKSRCARCRSRLGLLLGFGSGILPGAAAHFGSAAGDGFTGSSLYGIPPNSVDFAATRTSGHEGAPVARHDRPFPVVVYSPGAGDP